MSCEFYKWVDNFNDVNSDILEPIMDLINNSGLNEKQAQKLFDTCIYKIYRSEVTFSNGSYIKKKNHCNASCIIGE